MKKALSVITGVITGIVIVFIGDATSHSVNHITGNADITGSNVSHIPMYVLVVMVGFWLLSAFLGGLVAARLNRIVWKRNALVTGGILLAAALLNLISMTHPAWIWIAVLVGYIPAALLGGWLVRPK